MNRESGFGDVEFGEPARAYGASGGQTRSRKNMCVHVNTHTHSLTHYKSGFIWPIPKMVTQSRADVVHFSTGSLDSWVSNGMSESII